VEKPPSVELANGKDKEDRGGGNVISLQSHSFLTILEGT
jgi:hypothetical protein